MYLGNQVWNDSPARILLFRFHDLAAAFGQIGDQFSDIDALVQWCIGLDVLHRTVEQLPRPPSVFVAEMMEANRDLNQTLIEFPRRTLVVLPEVFPDLVSLEKLAVVEVLHPLHITFVIVRGLIKGFRLAQAIFLPIFLFGGGAVVQSRLANTNCSTYQKSNASDANSASEAATC